MTGNPPDQEPAQELATTAHAEVEFALVLSRTIDFIKSDPEQLRGAVYELARQKLREQFSHEDASQVARLTAALEVAIEGVEAHSRKDTDRQALTFNPRPATLAIADRQYPEMEVLGPPDTDASVGSSTWTRPPLLTANPDQSSSLKRASFAGPLRFVLVIGLLVAVVLVIAQRSGQLARFWPTKPAETAQETQSSAKVAAAAPAKPEPPKVDPLIPTSFGIFAVSGGKLYQLDPLQGHAPDIRVAVSAVITTPSQTILPDGHPKFIVFRRDSGNSAPDGADVRIIAKVEQATTFDPAGKPVVAKNPEDNWVIRNISQPYRTSPMKDNPDMYEVQNRDPDTALTPGRYALVIRGQAYDFTVAGTVTDIKQCLARLTASNGTFYSACEKLP